MIIDGKALAETLQDELRKKIQSLPKQLTLSVVSLTSSTTTRQFVEVKKYVGEKLGVVVEVVVPEVNTTGELVAYIDDIAKTKDGIIVQLPVPDAFDLDVVLNAVPRTHDVDVLGDQARDVFTKGISQVLPPVVAAMREILRQNNIEPKNKKVVVVGTGRLVGGPAAVWFRHQGAHVGVVNRETENLDALTKDADIIALGAGSPGLLKPDMVSDGVVVLDAGSGEVSGRVVGDADKRVADKASLFTPTPGGIGPIAVTMIFANLITLYTERTLR